MKFKQLEIHNIASIADATIDFDGEQLRNQPIFLISGETGSGKSTLLDCICLALYRDTPRLINKTKDEYHTGHEEKSIKTTDIRQLLRRGTGEGFIRFSFIGANGGNYTAELLIRRSRNKANGKLQGEQWRLTREDTHQSFTIVREIQPEITNNAVGLDFNQFCRTVMLAQGQFALFLNGTQIEKSEILEKLTDTAIFSRISERISAHYNDAKHAYETVSERLGDVSLLSEQQIADINLQISQVDEQIRINSAAAEKLNKQAQWIQTERDLTTRLAQAETALQQATQRANDDQTRQQILLLNQWHASAEARVHLHTVRQTEAKIREQVQHAATLKNQLDQLHTLLNIEHSRLPQELQSATTGQIKQLISDRQTLLERKRETIEQLNPKDIIQQRQQIERHKDALNQFAQTLQIIDERREALNNANAQLEHLKEELEQAKSQIPILEAIAKQKATALDTAIETYNSVALSVDERVREIRQKLNPGDHCPVCGTKVTEILHEQHFQSILAPIEQQRRKAEKENETAQTDLKSQQNAITRLKSGISRHQREIEDNQQKNLNNAIAQAERLRSKTGCPSDTDPNEWLAAERDQADQQLNQLNQRQEEVNRLNDEREAIQEQLNRLENVLNLAQARAHIQAAARNLNAQPQTVTNPKTVNDLTDTCRTLESDTLQWQNRKNTLENTLESHLAHVRAFIADKPDIGQAGLDTLARITPQTIEETENQISEINTELRKCQGAAEQINRQITEHRAARPDDLPENPDLEQIRSDLSENQSRITTLGEQKGELNAKLNHDNEQRQIKGELQAQADSLREVFQQWEMLNKCLGLRGNSPLFRTVAQSFILGDLLEKANVYMRQFNDRYTLTCQHDSLTILLQDTTTGGISSVNTFSGGEGFMAALALALALSQLNIGAQTVDTLFIDEGFGSLSGEYLERVMATLRQMRRAGGRRVGIISHVARLNETVPTVIHVTRGPGCSAPATVSITSR